MRLSPTSIEEVVLGARIGPSGRPARRVSRVLPFAVGKDEALPVGAGCGGGFSLLSELEPPHPVASATRPSARRLRERGTGRILGRVVQSALNRSERREQGMAERAAIVTGASSGIGLALAHML